LTLAAAARGARVVAVDASPRRAEHLRLSVTVNDMSSVVVVVPAAIGVAPGTARYLTRRSDRRVVEGSSSNDLVEVTMTTVAELVARYGRPDVVRVRTPGWEADVLRGAAGALDRCRVIGVGADLVALAERGRGVSDVVERLGSTHGAPAWLDGPHRRAIDATRPFPDGRVDLVVGAAGPGDALTDPERIVRYAAEAAVNPAARRARLAADLADAGALLEDVALQAVLERLLLDPAERVARAAAWWRSHAARTTSVVDRAHALQAVLATRLSLD
jgi:FkbM family methyltransferase